MYTKVYFQIHLPEVYISMGALIPVSARRIIPVAEAADYAKLGLITIEVKVGLADRVLPQSVPKPSQVYIKVIAASQTLLLSY